jgi:hypothetical protein
MISKLAILSFFASPTLAQVWGTQGTWEMVLPVPDSNGNLNSPNQAFWNAGFVAGNLLISANSTTSQLGLDLYKFNIVTQTWSSPYIFTPGGNSPLVQEPFVFAYGGFAIIIDESNPTVMYFIDSNAASNSSWTPITVVGNPLLLNRLGQRFLVWGSQLYMFGGYVPSSSPTTPSVQYNDLWVTGLSQAILGNGAAWALVSPPADSTTGLVPGYPPPRIGYTWTPYQVGAIMFGGLSTSKQGDDVFSCFRQVTPNPDCFFHENVWGLLPGYVNVNVVPNQMPTTAWVRLGYAGNNGGPTPTGRAFHSAGQMGNQLYVYGGFTAKGPSSELWAYDLTSQNWGLVTSSGPSPSGRGPSVVAGFHFYVYTQNFIPGQGVIPGSGQLYRWTPTLFAGGGNNNQGYNAAAMNAIAAGHTAGIVLGLLLGLANLYVLFRLAQNARVSIFDFGFGGAGKAYSLPSFTTSDMSAAYEAPSL